MIAALVSIYLIINIALLLWTWHEIYTKVVDDVLSKHTKYPDGYIKIACVLIYLLIIFLGLPILSFYILKYIVNKP